MIERPKPRTREEQAKLEIGHTEISLGVKWTLFVVGISTLFAVPAVQTYREMRQYAEGRRDSPWPQCCDLFDALPRAAAAYREHDGGRVSKVFRGNAVLMQTIDRYEKDLKAESFLTQLVLPPTQAVLLYAGSGNEKAYVGRGRWLFYRPGIDYCVGPGFWTRGSWPAGPAVVPSRERPRSPTRVPQSSSSIGNLRSGTSGWCSCRRPTRPRSTLRSSPRAMKAGG